MEWYEKFEKVIELIGSDEVAKEVIHYFPSNNLKDFTEHLISSRDLDSEFETNKNMEKNTTIHFENASAMCLYFMEMEGQLSDGKYENSHPYDHWKWLLNVNNAVVDGKSGLENASHERGFCYDIYYRKKYNLNEWFSKYIRGWRKDGKKPYMWATRIIAYGKFGKIYPNITYNELKKFDYIEVLLESLQMKIEEGENDPEKLFNELTNFSKYEWRRKYFESCKDYFTLDFIKKFIEMDYDIKECKTDVKLMENAINRIY